MTTKPAINTETLTELTQSAVMACPMIEWAAAEARYGVAPSDFKDNKTIASLCLAALLNHAITGNYEWERFEAMGMAELAAATNTMLSAGLPEGWRKSN